jgi:hypothetical protein
MKRKAVFCAITLVCMFVAFTSLAAATPQPIRPEIDIEKLVSLGSVSPGIAWHDADDLPGPHGLVGSEVYFKYIGMNTGNVPFYSIQLIEYTSIDLSGCIIAEPLMPGNSFECVVGPFTLPAGQHSSTVSARGWYDGGYAEDSDAANYFGADVDIDLENSVSVDGQESWHDADEAPGPYGLVGEEAYFKYQGTNSGNVPLFGISISDSMADVDQFRCIIFEPLMPGDSFECVVGPFKIEAGQQSNSASAHGRFMDWSARDSDAAHYFGADVEIYVEHYIGVQSSDSGSAMQWHDADQPPGLVVVVGSEIYFKLWGKNVGNVPLESVDLIDVTSERRGCIIVEPVMPGATFECISGPYSAQAGTQVKVSTAIGTFGSWSAQDSDMTCYQGVYVLDGSGGRFLDDAAGAERAPGGAAR